MRSKEDAHDYSYFPDPDLMPLVLDQAWVDEIEKTLPELPDEKKARLIKAGLSPYDASVLVAEKESRPTISRPWSPPAPRPRPPPTG